MAEAQTPAQISPAPPSRRVNPIRRLGCGALLVIWFLILLLPAVMLALAVRGEIALWHGGDIPEPDAHPLVQLRLVMDARTRGVNVTTSQPLVLDGQTCVQTDVRYVLWQGRGEDVRYCDCYTRPADGAPWELMTTHSGTCEEG